MTITLKNCPHCGLYMISLGFNYYHCTLTTLKYPHYIEGEMFNPLCLLAQYLP